jgi:hypothetical protein
VCSNGWQLPAQFHPKTTCDPSSDKFAAYRQHENVEVYRRQGENWLFSEVSGLEQTLTLELIGCQLKLAEDCEQVTFQ